MRNDKGNKIVEMTIQFAVKLIEFTEKLEESRKYVIAKQILRSGTSIGSSVREAQNAESKADFIHKMKIAAKEADETDYWFLLCKEAKNYFYDEGLHDQLNIIMKIISKIISSSKKQ
ncbi:MAG: four helix bundle protein [Bacteroidales bacterium]|nr:four helix bundle protein [Bacteroidales bacterium]